MEQPIGLTLTGPGGGTWRLEQAKRGRLRVVPGAASDTAAQISGAAIDFPSWATTRTSWRDNGLTITGDEAYATRFLEQTNLV